jgi:uncharacterized repeat protein (TIGR01451 family)
LLSFKPVKSVDKPMVCLGDEVRYTVRIKHTGSMPLTDVFLLERLPKGLDFIPGSVTINGTKAPRANPERGLPLPDISSWSKVVICFSAKASNKPRRNPVISTTEISYKYTPIKGTVPGSFTQKLNEVPVLVLDCDETCAEMPSHNEPVCKAFKVSKPLCISPYAVAGKPKVRCAGKAQMTPGRKRGGNGNSTFEFTIRRKIKVDIPMKFGADVCYDKACVVDTGNCDEP